MPTRYLKPGIRDSELIDMLSPMAEVMFYRILVTVDDFGRFDARPTMLKSHCFPVKEKITAKHCEEYLKELAEAGLVFVYQHENKPYMQVCKWDNVPRSKESKYPAYEDGCIQMYTSVCNPSTVLPVTVTETETETETETVTETKTRNRATYVATPDGVSDSVWSDFQKLRTAKKAPLTEAAISGIRREAEKAGWSLEAALQECCLRGWTGFKADWVASNNGPPGLRHFNKQEALEASNRSVAERWLKKQEAQNEPR